jgi:hypothetical protein
MIFFPCVARLRARENNYAADQGLFFFFLLLLFSSFCEVGGLATGVFFFFGNFVM